MEDEMTGLNPEQAKQQLDTFHDAIDDAMSDMHWTYERFARELSTKWYSPRAKEFGDKTDVIMSNYIREMYRVLYTILNNAVASYNILAMSNGLGSSRLDAKYDLYPNDDGLPWYNSEYSIHFEEVSPSGAVGMNVLLVQTLINVFNEQMQKSANALDDIPIDIAFYDPDGTLKQTFKDLIMKFKDNYINQMKEIIAMIKDAMNEEINDITIAKQQATDALTTNA